MLKKLLLSCLLLMLSSFSITQADTLVLVHGYLSKGMDWRTRGIVQVFQQNHWADGGHYTYGPSDIITQAADTHIAGNVLYTVDLPWRESIKAQSYWLEKYIQHIAQERQENIHILAHSAGGIVSRLLLVNQAKAKQALPIKTLITIAAPHLGTPNADMTLLAADSPLGELAAFMGINELQSSQAVYKDLRLEYPGNFIYWLNRQPHPIDVRYISLVRLNEDFAKADYIVPPKSQDMRNVPALHFQAKTFFTQGSHLLNAHDGVYAASLLNMADTTH